MAPSSLRALKLPARALGLMRPGQVRVTIQCRTAWKGFPFAGACLVALLVPGAVRWLPIAWCIHEYNGQLLRQLLVFEFWDLQYLFLLATAC